MAIMYLDPAEIRCSDDESDTLLISMSAYLAHFCIATGPDYVSIQEIVIKLKFASK
jgi:hypothetical protein